MYFSLIREHGFRDELARPGESRREQAVRIWDMYQEVQTDIHGPEHLTNAVRRREDNQQVVSDVPQPTGVIAEQNLPGAGVEEYVLATPCPASPASDSPDRLLLRPKAIAI